MPNFQPGDRVRIAETWALYPDLPAGTVAEIAGAWIAVRFDGERDTIMCMARELERE